MVDSSSSLSSIRYLTAAGIESSPIIFGCVGIRRFELVARRPAGYAVAMEVARRPEGPEVNGDLRKTVSRRSLVPSRELK